MDNDLRETKTILTPGGHEIILRAWVTGREKRELKNVFLENINLSTEGESVKTSPFNASSLIDKAENKALEIIIVSLDGNSENLLEVILNLPADEYDFIIKEVNKISGGFSLEKKTK